MTLQDDTDRLREAWRDLAYQLTRPLDPLIERFGPRFGLRVKPWVRERQIREKWSGSAGICQKCGKHADKRYGGEGHYPAVCLDCWCE